MARHGDAGLIQPSQEALLLPWAKLNDVEFNRVVPGTVSGKGGALIADEDISSNEIGQQQTLLTVPRDLILSLERVQEHAKVDRDFREVLEALEDFGRVCCPSHVVLLCINDNEVHHLSSR